MSLFLLPSAITVKRRDSHQRTDLFAIERSQLGQERYDHRGRDVADSGYTLQPLVVLTPRRTLLKESLKLPGHRNRYTPQPFPTTRGTDLQNFNSPPFFDDGRSLSIPGRDIPGDGLGDRSGDR